MDTLTLQLDHEWSMPNHLTFNIRPIKRLLSDICLPIGDRVILDPFSNRNHGFATNYNDINPDNYGSNMDALEWLKTFDSYSADIILFDPPYSLRQLKECYEGIGLSLTQDMTQNYFTDLKKEISRVLKTGGTCVSFGWNTNGIGKNLGFQKIRIMVLHHGGLHNDTLVLVEKNLQRRLF